MDGMSDKFTVIFESADGTARKAMNFECEDFARTVESGRHAELVREVMLVVEDEIGPGSQIVSTLVNGVDQPSLAWSAAQCAPARRGR
jgi:hypothetical protein